MPSELGRSCVSPQTEQSVTAVWYDLTKYPRNQSFEQMFVFSRLWQPLQFGGLSVVRNGDDTAIRGVDVAHHRGERTQDEPACGVADHSGRRGVLPPRY